MESQSLVLDKRPSAGCCGGIAVDSASCGCEYRQGNKCQGQYPSDRSSATHWWPPQTYSGIEVHLRSDGSSTVRWFSNG